jgi:xylulose-5-phosphate/fructose-6-phosphate phosphoketolase
MDVIDRVPRLQAIGAHAKEKFRNIQIECVNYSHENGVDRPEEANWKWPY